MEYKLLPPSRSINYTKTAVAFANGQGGCLVFGVEARGQNLIGPHRDDLTLTLHGMPAREFASNGEMWTMALALKMALYEPKAVTMNCTSKTNDVLHVCVV